MALEIFSLGSVFENTAAVDGNMEKVIENSDDDNKVVVNISILDCISEAVIAEVFDVISTDQAIVILFLTSISVVDF